MNSSNPNRNRRYDRQPQYRQPGRHAGAQPGRRGARTTLIDQLAASLLLLPIGIGVAVWQVDFAPADLAPIFSARMVIGWLAALNLAAFAAFGIDKARAESGGWRVQEFSLLLLAFFGGTIGAYAGRAAFRHKTSKQPFSNQLFTILVVQVAVIGGLIAYRFF